MMLWRKDVKPGASAPPRRDLRTRYIPRARIRPFYLQAAPWLDLLFILFFLVLAQSRLVLRPGMVVALPEYEGVGIQGGAIAVLVPHIRGEYPDPALYFDDTVYRLQDEGRTRALLRELERAREVDQVGPLTLYADERVPQAYVMQVMDLAARAGFDQLNIGTAPPTLSTP